MTDLIKARQRLQQDLWSIHSIEDVIEMVELVPTVTGQLLEATHNTTGEVFSGTPAAFNAIFTATKPFATTAEFITYPDGHVELGGLGITPTILFASGRGSLGTARKLLTAGAIAGDVAVGGMKATDRIDEVIMNNAGAWVDLTAEFTPLADKMNNAAGTSSAGKQLMIRWTTF